VNNPLLDRIYHDHKAAQLVKMEMSKISYPMSDEQREEVELEGLLAYSRCLRRHPDCFEAYARTSIRRAMRRRLDKIKPPPKEEPREPRDRYLEEIRECLPALYQYCDEIDRQIADRRFATMGKASVEVIAEELGIGVDEVLERLERIGKLYATKVVNPIRHNRNRRALKCRVSSGILPPPTNRHELRLWSEAYENASHDTLRKVSEHVKDRSVYRRTQPSIN